MIVMDLKERRHFVLWSYGGDVNRMIGWVFGIGVSVEIGMLEFYGQGFELLLNGLLQHFYTVCLCTCSFN